MGCACNKKRKSTSWGTGTARDTSTSPVVPRKEEVDNGPTTLTLADGTTEDYPTRFDAHMAKIKAGGGTLSTTSSTS